MLWYEGVSLFNVPNAEWETETLVVKTIYTVVFNVLYLHVFISFNNTNILEQHKIYSVHGHKETQHLHTLE